MSGAIDLEKIRAFDGKSTRNGATGIAGPFEVLLAAAPDLAAHYAMAVMKGYSDEAVWQLSMVCGRYLRDDEALAAGDIVRVASPMVEKGHAWALVIAAEGRAITEALVLIEHTFHRLAASPGTVEHVWRVDTSLLFEDSSPRGRLWGPAMAKMRELLSHQLVLMERDFLRLVLKGSGITADDAAELATKLGAQLRPLDGPGDASPPAPGDLVFNAERSRCAVLLANHQTVMSWNFSMDNYATIAPIADLAPAFVWSPGGAGPGAGDADGGPEGAITGSGDAPDGVTYPEAPEDAGQPEDPEAAHVFATSVGAAAAGGLEQFGWRPAELAGFARYRFHPGSARDLRVGPGGRFFVDGAGRAAFLRGVNFGARCKLPPYLPVIPDGALTPAAMAAALQAAGPQLDLLRAMGANVVRLLVMWKALEPEPAPSPDALTPAGQQYLHLVGQIVDALYQRGIFCFLDFHQDLAHDVYGGDGFPDWAVHIDAEHPRQKPAGFDNAKWATLYYDTWIPAAHSPYAKFVRRTLRSFWDNHLTNTERGLTGFPVQDHLVNTIGQVARFFRAADQGKGHPGILGYEPFNEPPQVGIERAQFERQVLPSYYGKVHAAVRRHDPAPFLFLEPRVDWSTYPLAGDEFPGWGLGFTLKPETALGVSCLNDAHVATYANQPARDGRVVFSFHHYDPWTLFWGNPGLNRADDMNNKAREWPSVYRHLRHAAESRAMIPFITELGGSQEWVKHKTALRPDVYRNQQIRAYMDLQYQEVERQHLNATYWNYDLYNTAEHGDAWNHEDFSLLGPGRAPRNIDIIARPYPMRCTAWPGRMAFDLGTRVGSMAFHAGMSRAPTVIYVPRDLHYPGDTFFVRATSPILRWDARAQLLYFLPDTRLPANLVVITPRPEVTPAELPPESRELLRLATHVFQARAIAH